jgi:hypothetical protein
MAASAVGVWAEDAQHEQQVLVAAGMSSNPLADGEQQQLLNAAKQGWAEELQALVSGGSPINVTDADGRSAVYWAARGGSKGGGVETGAHVECLRLLLEACPPQRKNEFVGLHDSTGCTALIGEWM